MGVADPRLSLSFETVTVRSSRIVIILHKLKTACKLHVGVTLGSVHFLGLLPRPTLRPRHSPRDPVGHQNVVCCCSLPVFYSLYQCISLRWHLAGTFTSYIFTISTGICQESARVLCLDRCVFKAPIHCQCSNQRFRSTTATTLRVQLTNRYLGTKSCTGR